MLLMAFQHCSHQLYLKTRVEDQSKYICADCEDDLLKCAGRIAHAKVCVRVYTLCYYRMVDNFRGISCILQKIAN